MLRPCLLDSDNGMTVLELLVAGTLSMVLFAGAFGTTKSIRGIYSLDLTRTRLNQNVRSAVDFVGIEVRQSGERLPSGMLAIELANGTSGAPDTLTLRRNVLDEVLTVCQTINAGTSANRVYLSTSAAGASPACLPGGQATNQTAWNGYRTDKGGQVKAYIYDFSTRLGEFIEYSSEGTSGGQSYITITSKTFANQYVAQSAAIYAMVQWEFQIDPVPNSQILQVVENNDTANPKKVVFGVTNFQIQAILTDGTVKDTFGSGDSWTQLAAIDVSVSGNESLRDHPNISTTLRSRFFPRNILSS